VTKLYTNAAAPGAENVEGERNTESAGNSQDTTRGTLTEALTTADPLLHGWAAVVAAQCTAAGQLVVPLLPCSKHPLWRTGTGHLEGALCDAADVLAVAEGDYAGRDWSMPRAGRPGWGLVTGRGIVVLDLDTLDAIAWLDRLGAARPEVAAWVAATARVSTGRGLHLYGATPDALPTSTSALAPGVDVKGQGGFVCLPGCQHPLRSTIWRRR